MRTTRWFEISFWLCCVALAVPLWTVDYLPMVDLPQHAAQVAIWSRWDQTEAGYQAIYLHNWFTPYLVGYLLAIALTPILPVNVALTLVVTLAIVGIPIATRVWLRESGGSPWWVFAVFPAVYGFAFDWGFFNFVVGVPLTIVSLPLLLRFVRDPTAARAFGATGVLLGLFFVHALLFAYAAAVVAAACLVSRAQLKRIAVVLAPVVVVSAVAAGWLAVTRDTESMVQRDVMWELPGESFRLFRIVSEAVGENLSSWSVLAGVLAFGLPFVLGGRLSRSSARWVPFGVAAAFFSLVPFEVFGTAYLYGRYAVFLLPTWLYGFERSEDTAVPPMRLVLGPALALACTLGTFADFRGYQQEVEGLAEIIETMPEHARVLSVPVHRASRHMRTPVFLHAPAWYQAHKGGVVDFSFASNFPPLFRYREDAASSVPQQFVWNPGRLDWEAFDGDRYDFVLVRDLDKRPSVLIERSDAPMTFLRRRGGWQLFGEAPKTDNP